MTEIRVSGVSDFDELGRRWRDLEYRAAGSFFQSWSWTGALAAERFDDPVLVEATDGDRTVALALFNRVTRSLGRAELHLGESGDPKLDSPWIEQNGVLAEAGRELELTEACLRAVTAKYGVFISGADASTLAVLRRAAAHTRLIREQESPYVDLDRLRADGGDYVASRGTNTRQQIGRSDRIFSVFGPIAMARAETRSEALAMLDQLASLHQIAWVARGQPGAFSRPFFRRFHDAVVESALPLGQIAMLRFATDETAFGFLYNFVYRGQMLAYQSGFAYRPGDPKAKPGLTCHARAIALALQWNLSRYDFLAGEDRYKRNLGDAAHTQYWAESGPFWSPKLLARAVAASIRTRPSATGPDE